MIIVALLLALVAQAPAAPAAVSGRVTIAGKPAPNVVVTLLPAGWGEDAAGSPRTTTDAEGRYRLETSVSGQYVVGAFAPGFAGPTDNRTGRPGKTVTLVTGETVDGLDIELSRGAVITGRVTTSDGRPIVGEGVHLYLLDDRGEPQPVDNAFDWFLGTDDRGIYRAFGLLPGRYLVALGRGPNMASHGGRAYPLTYHPGAPDKAQATVVTVAAGGEATAIDIVARRPGKTYVITGRIVDAETGAPVPRQSLTVQVNMPDGGYLHLGIGVRSGPAGEFRLDGMKPGRYAIVISPEEDAGGFYGRSEELSITDHDVTGVEVVARAGALVEGVLVVEGTNDRQLVSQLEESWILLRPTDPAESGLMEFGGFGRVKPDGTFRVAGVRPGRYGISFNATREIKNLTVVRVEHGGLVTANTVDVQSVEPLTGVRIVLAYGRGAIRGEVKTADGPLGSMGERVSVAARRAGSSGHGKDASIDERGQFLIDGLAPGEYEVRVLDFRKGYSYDPPVLASKTVTVADDAAVPVAFTIDLGDASSGGNEP